MSDTDGRKLDNADGIKLYDPIEINGEEHTIFGIAYRGIDANRPERISLMVGRKSSDPKHLGYTERRDIPLSKVRQIASHRFRADLAPTVEVDLNTLNLDAED